jgi:hypothetical protein
MEALFTSTAGGEPLRQRVRQVIADWSQGAAGAGRQVGGLARLGLANLIVRFKKDQPYVWDPAAGRMSWSYGASRGLLHHKTLAVLVEKPRSSDARPTIE